jgi:hypothetical protein
MKAKSLSLAIFLIFIGVIFSLSTWAYNADWRREARAFDIGVEGYIYGYPLVLMNATKQVAIRPEDRRSSTSEINTFIHFRKLVSPGDTLVISPNVDTLYSNAWLDLSKGPLLLHIPKTTGRYYVMGMLDAWTNVFANPGTRTDGSDGDDFVIVGPHWNGELPSNLTKITASTDSAWIILRIECFGPEDYESVHSLQNQFTIHPLDTKEIPIPLSLSTVPNAPSPESVVSHMNAKEFFGTMEELLTVTPPDCADALIVDKLASIEIFPQKPSERQEIDPAIKRGLEKSIQVAKSKIKAAIHFSGQVMNGWRMCKTMVGAYGTDYLLRASIACWALGANLPEDTVYPFTYVDIDGDHLNGENRYRIHFEQDQIPPVHAFWSITMYDANHFLVANPMDRYAIQSHNHLEYNTDGSLDIIIQRKAPQEKPTNWLPSPKGEFNLILRMYWPKPQVLDGSWSPPAVEKVDRLCQ